MTADEARKYLADYHAKADAERASRLGASRPLVAPSVEYGAAKAFEVGAAVTKPASKGPRPWFEQHPVIPKTSSARFDSKYPVFDKATERRRKRVVNRRTSGSWSDLPPCMRYHYTEAERAALHVVVNCVLKHGFCDLSLKEIGDIAGVSRSSAKNAITEARKLKHLKVQYRPRTGLNHLPSIITIVSKEWISWLSKRSLAGKRMSTLRNSSVRKDRKEPVATPQGALERERAGSAEPITIAERAVAKTVAVHDGFSLANRCRLERFAANPAGRGVVYDFAPPSGTGGGRNAL